MMIMMKKKLHTTHTHKYIWCIFLEISKWGGSREWCEEPGKHTHTHILRSLIKFNKCIIIIRERRSRT